jgi:16S rRNA (guanine966-N2)-methyltransferase
MRVIGGEKGGRRLLAPPGRWTRPTSDKVREAAFSMLASLDVVEGARVWDLFAGSGAMGIEALSRGASHATFVEQGRDAVSVIRTNLASLGYGPGAATVVVADVVNWVRAHAGEVMTVRPPQTVRSEAPPVRRGRGEEVRAPGRATAGAPVVDLVTADPPYSWNGWATLLRHLAPLRPLLLAETGEALALPKGWRALRSKQYGGTVVTLAQPLGPDEKTDDKQDGPE